MYSYHKISTSNHSLFKILRTIKNAVANYSIPAPFILIKLFLLIYLFIRCVYYYCRRVFLCEPLFKAYCKKYGRNVHTDIYVHWISGKGDLIVGDNVLLSGLIGIGFASRFSENPTLRIGSNTFIGHACSFSIGKSITIGDHCYIASRVSIMDSNGHPKNPNDRRQGLPPSPDTVKPVYIGDNVWIGLSAIILPGVEIGNDCIIGAGAVVTKNVPPGKIVAGNPAKIIGEL